MNRREIPPALRDSFGEIRGSTERLIRAAESCDPAEIREAVDQRGEAMERFTGLLDSMKPSLSANQRDAIRREYESLADQAGEAESRLASLASHSRESVRTHARSASAVRGYRGSAAALPSALDRSG